MRRLVHDVSAARENPMPREQVDVLFDGMWPRLEAVVAEAIRVAPERRGPKRTPEDMLAELIDTGRCLERGLDGLAWAA
jgi:lambda repressor-like predicted transcriptional regulator